MIESGHTLLTLATVLGTDWLLVLTPPAVSELDVYSALLYVSLKGSLVLSSIEVGQYLLVVLGVLDHCTLW